MRDLIVVHFILILSGSLIAQSVRESNLIFNGDFEKKNSGFSSDYRYEEEGYPGSYTVTRDASFHSPEFKNPLHGDHTKGRGYFLVANMDGTPSKKIWSTRVKVVPNAHYEFSAYFCNVYALLPPTSNFAFEDGDVKGNDPELKVMIGSQVIAVEKDFYHLFRWVRISGTWYSGKNTGMAEISIVNLNTSVSGNDVALDDISLTYIETMPDDFELPQKTQTVVDRYFIPPKLSRKVALSEYGEFEFNDTVTEGVYVLHPKPWHPIRVEEDPLVLTPIDTNTYERITLHHLIFEQTRAELKESSRSTLNLIAQWMQRDTTVRIRFIGHTDNQGDSLLNVQLSEMRVLNVKNYLISKGIAANRIQTVGYGGMFPVADNKREETRKLNRRVEMEILSK